MYNALTSPIACLALSLLAYSLGLWINEKTKSPFANPLLISCLIVGAVIVIFKIPLETYNEGGGVLTLCLTPATIALAVPIYISSMPALFYLLSTFLSQFLYTDSLKY